MSLSDSKSQIFRYIQYRNELRIGYFAAGFAEEDVVVGVGFKRWIEIDEIDALVREFAAIP